jgi:hypothetical protein
MEGISHLLSLEQGRTAGIKQRYFVLVQYGPELDVAHGNGGQGGSILSFLQPTVSYDVTGNWGVRSQCADLQVHLQLINVLPQLRLPSPLGLSLHLHVTSSPAAPNIDESIWNHLFARYLLTTATSVPVDPCVLSPFGGLPIAAHPVLRVDAE